MINFLDGEVIQKGKDYLTVNVGGVGYQVYSSDLKIKIGSRKQFYIYHNIKEDVNDLYGFIEPEKLQLFKLLISVSGVGPKLALTILKNVNTSNIISAIEHGKTALFKSIPGIGTKVASKIVIELKNKISKTEIDFEDLQDSDQLIDGLKNLGINPRDIRTYISKMPNDLTDTSSQLKWILKHIGGKFDTDQTK